LEAIEEESDGEETKGEPAKETSMSTSSMVDVGDVEIDDDLMVHSLTVECALSCPKLPMLSIAEATAASCYIRSSIGIENCYVVKGREGGSMVIQTDGVSFETAWKFAEQIDVNKISSNDIGRVLETYGVEAARMTIINECKNIFVVYGIQINPRHLRLIADYMTQQVSGD